MVFGAEFFSNETSVGSLVKIRSLKTNGEGFHRPMAGAGHQRDDGGRIRATAQQCADRNISYQTNPHRLGKLFLELIEAFLFSRRRVCAILRQIPVLAYTNLSFFEFQEMTRRQLLNPEKRSRRVGNIAKIEILQ